MNTKGSMIVENGQSLEFVQRLVGNMQAAILDVGCGTGIFLESLRRGGYRNLYGADIDNSLASSAVPSDRFFKTDLSFGTVPVPNEYFDVVSAWEVVEHLENPHNFIREAYRILKPGGYFFVSIPNPFHLISWLLFLKRGNMPRWTKRNNHITIFTKDLIWKAFLRDYFDPVETRYPVGECTYGFFKWFDGHYPENEFFGHFLVLIMKKKQA